MSSRARSGSLPRPCMTWTKPAASGSPVTSTVTSLLSLKLASPVNNLEVSAHQRSSSGRSLLARGASSARKAGRGDKGPLLGPPRGRAQPAGGPGGELLGPPVERGPDLPRIGHLSLKHLNKHHDPLRWADHSAVASSAPQTL